ncbi:hypothetical protein ACR779_07955 [Sphingobacterium lactis]
MMVHIFGILFCEWLINNDNGSCIGEGSGLESQNFHFCTKLSNSLLLFSKFMKKGNIKSCCEKKGETFDFSLIPPFHQYDVSGQGLFLSFHLSINSSLHPCTLGRSHPCVGWT